MSIGTRSVLIGAHCFFIHPLFVALAWWRLFGFPWDLRLWVAFFVHDIGYIGKPNMDGPEGETHPELGARIMRFLFDHPHKVRPRHKWNVNGTPGGRVCERCGVGLRWKEKDGSNLQDRCFPRAWHDFTLYHSRTYAKRDGAEVSRLCYADKYAFVLEPAWLYLPRVFLTGELPEYLGNAREHNRLVRMGRKAGKVIRIANPWHWKADIESHFQRWLSKAEGAI